MNAALKISVVLNAAGSRASEEAGVDHFVKAVLSHALKPMIR